MNSLANMPKKRLNSTLCTEYFKRLNNPNISAIYSIQPVPPPVFQLVGGMLNSETE